MSLIGEVLKVMSLKTLIEEKLRIQFSPSYLDVINESYLHNVPQGSESHFKVVVVSKCFYCMRAVARHQQVNNTLRDEINNGVHALSIQTLTPDEWNDKNNEVSTSPLCLGGQARQKAK